MTCSGKNDTLDGQSLSITNVNRSASGVTGLLSALATIPALYSAAGSMAGFAHRVGQLSEALEELEAAEVAISKRCAPLQATDIAVRNLSVVTPAGRQLVAHVSFDVSAGHSLIIMGPSGVLRWLAGG
jgi:ABC-type uncharacterized transport system fused permease/ATPase subunit